MIKLGSAYLNMDQVTDVWVNRRAVTLFFAAPTMYSAAPFREVTNAITTREIRFHGAQAAALIRWLEKRAKDLTPEIDDVERASMVGEADEAPLPDAGTVDDGPSA